MAGSLDELLASLPQNRIPPVDQWHPPRRGEIDIRIAADGRWYHEGGEIRRPQLVKLFASILRRDDEGYWLVTPAEQLRIEVEDAPLLATDLHLAGEGRAQMLVMTTHTEDRVVVDSDHPLWVEDPEGEPKPYVLVRDRLHARIHRNVFYRLVDLAVEEAAGLGVWSSGHFFPLAPLEKMPWSS